MTKRTKELHNAICKGYDQALLYTYIYIWILLPEFNLCFSISIWYDLFI